MTPSSEKKRMSSILLVDNEPDILEVLEVFVQGEAARVFKATSAAEALSLLDQNKIDVVISDIHMPDMSGLELLRKAKGLSPELAFVMITGNAQKETVFDALQHGAYDYLNKPLKMEDVQKIVRRALSEEKPAKRTSSPTDGRHLNQSLFQALKRNKIVWKSQKMREVFDTIGTIAIRDTTLLIMGETGTGKELAARAVHEASFRKDHPFISINCGAFPETLLESELFGYMKGAFTGATQSKDGLLELAGEGTIFLDEIGEMTPAMQVKLLRVLQDRKLRRLGGASELTIRARLIAATNRDLKSAISENLFREDLYYRIAVISIVLPPLRERPEDIELLAHHFIAEKRLHGTDEVQSISAAALGALMSYSWPGNIRELENTIERAMALESSATIQLDQLPDAIRNQGEASHYNPAPSPDNPAEHSRTYRLPPGPVDLQRFLSEMESSVICDALDRCGGNQTMAASQLSITLPSLRHKIQTLGISAASFRRQGTPVGA